jgi:putative transposase
MVVLIGGPQMYMWRAVDSEGEVLDALIQRRYDKAAALKPLRKQRFVSLHAAAYNTFNVQRHLIRRRTHRRRAEAHSVWSRATVAAA